MKPAHTGDGCQNSIESASANMLSLPDYRKNVVNKVRALLARIDGTEAPNA